MFSMENILVFWGQELALVSAILAAGDVGAIARCFVGAYSPIAVSDLGAPEVCQEASGAVPFLGYF